MPSKPPAEVEVGRAAVATSNGLAAILVPVRYPIQMAGRLAKLRVSLLDDGGARIRTWVLHERLGSGRTLSPEKRRRFAFVHRVGLGSALSPRLREGLRLRVRAEGNVDVDADGRRELGSSDRAEQSLPASAGDGPLCSSTPRLRLRPERRISVPLPTCATKVAWRVFEQPGHGKAWIRHGRLIYRAARRFRGSEQVQLIGKQLRGGANGSAANPLVPGYVQVTVSAESGVVVRALGDSVTAGFGYYSNGTPMAIGRLLGCRPAAKAFNDACSSNSLDFTSKEGKVEYAPDYGLANNVSWAAQWANSHGVTDFKNFAISGSEPKNWAPEGEFHETTEQIEKEDPDYILMTMGANPLLSDVLFGVDDMGCAVEADVLGGYRECVERAFAEVELQEHLKSLYSDLVQNTDATIFLMRYHLSVPSTALAYSATQIAMMGKLLNREIEAVATAVNPKRLQVVTPPHFNVGIDVSPVFPSRFSCSRLGYEVDGPSVQSTPTQDELEVLHPLSFCEGPAGDGPPWVISGDTGIHPSAAGYAQMASQVPPPG
ncbi:MAG TPA: SGNH/GDSL hydrolase family protein [Solirubrobacterales bacterium]|nr:SGNH/GDSL hydrolase family protein [Solirubrobacterales bacterium]